MGKEFEKTKFTTTNKIEEQRAKFQQLLHHFNTHDDPVDRFIKREQMREIQDWLKQYGINIEVP